MATRTVGHGSVQNRSLDDPSAAQMVMLQKIAEVIPGEVHIDEVGYEGDLTWVKFHVNGLADPYVALRLETSQHRLFDEQKMQDWQILAPGNHPKDRGLWLRHLKGLKTQETHCGVWFY